MITQSCLVRNLSFLSRAQWQVGGQAASKSCGRTGCMDPRDSWPDVPLALKGMCFDMTPKANVKGIRASRSGFFAWLKAFSIVSSAFSQKAKPGRDTPSAWGEKHSFLSGTWHEFNKDSITRSSKRLNQQNEFRTNLAWTGIGSHFASLKCLPAFPYNKSGL